MAPAFSSPVYHIPPNAARACLSLYVSAMCLCSSRASEKRPSRQKRFGTVSLTRPSGSLYPDFAAEGADRHRHETFHVPRWADRVLHQHPPASVIGPAKLVQEKVDRPLIIRSTRLWRRPGIQARSPNISSSSNCLFDLPCRLVRVQPRNIEDNISSFIRSAKVCDVFLDVFQVILPFFVR